MQARGRGHRFSHLPVQSLDETATELDLDQSCRPIEVALHQTRVVCRALWFRHPAELPLGFADWFAWSCALVWPVRCLSEVMFFS